MRIRTIKPEFWTNDDLAELPPIVRLLFIGLWNMADRRGRLEDRPKRIKVTIFPYDDIDIDEGLNQLQERGFIMRYKSGGYQVIQVVAFEKHQRISGTEAGTESKYPANNDGSTEEALRKQQGKEAPRKHSGSTLDDGRKEGRKEGSIGKDINTGAIAPVVQDPIDIPPELHSAAFTTSWAKWMTVRRGLGSKPKNWATLFGEQLKWLKDFGAEEATEIVNQSIRQGWKGLFERRKQYGTNSGNNQQGHDRVKNTANEKFANQYDHLG